MRWLSLAVFLTMFSAASASMEAAAIGGKRRTTKSRPDIRHVDGRDLYRNGQGIRSISFFGMDVQVYLAHFYSHKPLRTEDDVMTCDECPMQLDFTFLRSVNKSQAKWAWQQQLQYSVSFQYDGYEDDQTTFMDILANPIGRGDILTFQLIGDNTVIMVKGDEIGRIPGRNFQRAFLSMWFGKQPVTAELKEGLLSGTVPAHIGKPQDA